jgi:hypothetical protein
MGSDRLLRDPRFQPEHVVGALFDGRVICTAHLSTAAEDTAVTLERVRALPDELRQRLHEGTADLRTTHDGMSSQLAVS